MPKRVNLPAQDRATHISTFLANQFFEETPQTDLLEAGKYEFMRTKDFVIYNDNRKVRGRHKIKMWRSATRLAKLTGKPVYLDTKNYYLIANGVFMQFADTVRGMNEYNFHLEKAQRNAKGQVNDDDMIEVVSLSKSDLASYVKLDSEPINEYYANEFDFPEWFKPFLKQRHVRMMLVGQRFDFAEYSYAFNGLEKFKKDMARLKHRGEDIGKIYISLARMLSHTEEKHGEGRPIDLLLKALDVDADHHEGPHEIASNGLCKKCLKSSNNKIKVVMSMLDEKPKKVIFSGTKGYHLHWLEEIHEEDMINLIADVNSVTQLVDDFCFDDEGVRKFDMHRIFKLPNTIDATTCMKITTKLERVEVNDDIFDPHLEGSYLDTI